MAKAQHLTSDFSSLNSVPDPLPQTNCGKNYETAHSIGGMLYTSGISSEDSPLKYSLMVGSDLEYCVQAEASLQVREI